MKSRMRCRRISPVYLYGLPAITMNIDGTVLILSLCESPASNCACRVPAPIPKQIDMKKTKMSVL